MSPERKKLGRFISSLSKGFGGRVVERVGLKRLTTFKVGGLAQVMVFPGGIDDLAAAVDAAARMELPWRVLGAGSNLLVRDGGVGEVLVNVREAFQEMDVPGPENGGAGASGEEVPVRLGAGVKLPIAVKQCQINGLAGIEWAAGIPGSAGGAVIMNAGSLGASMADVVEWVEWIRPGEAVKRVARNDLDCQYRRLTRPPDAVVVAVGLRLRREDPRSIREEIIKGLKWRRQNQPLHYPSAGSVFKNPPGDYAGRMIEAVGLKGERIEDAQISDLHANFIVNRGRARSRDVEALIDLAREKVEKEFRVELELELEIIGEELPA